MPNTTFGLLHAMRSHQVSSPTVHESIAYGRPNACNLCHLDRTLAWTAEKLHEWHNQPGPNLSQDDQTIAAAVQWIVKGDAGQRVLMAWGFGWEPAQKSRAATGFTRTSFTPSTIRMPRSVSMRGNRCKRCPVSRISLLSTLRPKVFSKKGLRTLMKNGCATYVPRARVTGLRRCSTRMDVYKKIFFNGSKSSATISGSSCRNNASTCPPANYPKES